MVEIIQYALKGQKLLAQGVWGKTCETSIKQKQCAFCGVAATFRRRTLLTLHDLHSIRNIHSLSRVINLLAVHVVHHYRLIHISRQSVITNIVKVLYGFVSVTNL